MLTFTCLKIMNIAEWLKEELQKRGMSQADLSRKSGISAGHITKVLNGDRGLGEQALKGIAEAFHVPPELVFRKAGLLPQISENDEAKEELIFLFERLPDNEKRIILRQLQATILLLEQQGLIRKG